MRLVAPTSPRFTSTRRSNFSDHSQILMRSRVTCPTGPGATADEPPGRCRLRRDSRDERVASKASQYGDALPERAASTPGMEPTDRMHWPADAPPRLLGRGAAGRRPGRGLVGRLGPNIRAVREPRQTSPAWQFPEVSRDFSHSASRKGPSRRAHNADRRKMSLDCHCEPPAGSSAPTYRVGRRSGAHGPLSGCAAVTCANSHTLVGILRAPWYRGAHGVGAGEWLPNFEV